MMVRLESGSKIPPFEQLRAQLSLMVAAGRLVPGQRLPTIRELAGQLALSPGTVARAYQELERAGVVVGRGRAGTFVTDDPPVVDSAVERRERLATAAASFALSVRQLGVEDSVAIAALELALAGEPNEPVASAQLRDGPAD